MVCKLLPVAHCLSAYTNPRAFSTANMYISELPEALTYHIWSPALFSVSRNFFKSSQSWRGLTFQYLVLSRSCFKRLSSSVMTSFPSIKTIMAIAKKTKSRKQKKYMEIERGEGKKTEMEGNLVHAVPMENDVNHFHGSTRGGDSGLS
jgi:hypothetical protein